MEVTNWNPFAELDNLLSRGSFLNKLDDDPRMEWRPAADIHESKSEYLIKADLPEVKREDVELTVQGGVITLSGERKFETRDEGEKSHRVEKFYGSFRRSFTVPDNVDIERITATQSEGVLTVHLPKTQGSKPKSVAIEVH